MTAKTTSVDALGELTVPAEAWAIKNMMSAWDNALGQAAFTYSTAHREVLSKVLPKFLGSQLRLIPKVPKPQKSFEQLTAWGDQSVRGSGWV